MERKRMSEHERLQKLIEDLKAYPELREALEATSSEFKKAMKTCQATIGVDGCYRPDCDAQPIAEVVLVLPPFQDVTFPSVKLRTCEQHEGETGHYMASVLSILSGHPVVCRDTRWEPIA